MNRNYGSQNTLRDLSGAAASTQYHAGMPWEPLPGTRSDPVPLRASLERALAKIGAPRADVLQQVIESWDRLVGSVLAAQSRPLRMRGTVLVVAVTDAVFGAEIRWQESTLVAEIATLTGATDAVTRVDTVVRSEL